jgi:hypothetical protein
MSGNIKIADLEEKHFSPGQTDKYGPMRIPTDIKQQILRAIANIEYGSVEVVVHDGKVVQIECREKIRVGRHQPGRGVIP